jgi:hypothetical protein
MDDVTQRVFDLARGCIDELEKQKQYIQLLEDYIEEIESGVEVSAVKPVQLEQPLEMERANDNMDDRRPNALRNRRNAKGNKRTAGSVSDSEHGTDDSDGGSGSTEVSVDNSNAG